MAKKCRCNNDYYLHDPDCPVLLKQIENEKTIATLEKILEKVGKNMLPNPFVVNIDGDGNNSEICRVCGGYGEGLDRDTHDYIECYACGGSGTIPN